MPCLCPKVRARAVICNLGADRSGTASETDGSGTASETSTQSLRYVVECIWTMIARKRGGKQSTMNRRPSLKFQVALDLDTTQHMST
eukprot:364712-Chlamydomonas_euryale.AAC.5